MNRWHKTLGEDALLKTIIVETEPTDTSQCVFDTRRICSRGTLSPRNEKTSFVIELPWFLETARTRLQDEMLAEA